MIRLFLLGPQRVLKDEDRAVDTVVAQPKRFGLLAYLAVESARGPRRRDELVALFWPELDEAHARRALTYSVYFLRRELGEGAVTKQRVDDLGVDSASVWTDVAAFEQAIEERRYDDALALYRGDFLEGYFATKSPELDQWVDARRLRLHEHARAAAWSLVEAATRAGARGDTLRWARRALELAPDDERALREVVTALHAGGDVAGASAEYELFARRFEDLHGAPVSQQTRLLMDALHATPPPTMVAAADVASVAIVPPPPVIAPPPRRGRVVRMTAIAVGIVVAGVALISGIMASMARGPQPGADSSILLAVFPFSYHGAPELGYTSDGLATLLSAGMDHVGAIRTVSPRVLFGASRAPGDRMTLDDAARAAQRFGAGSFVLGDITAVGRRLRVAVTMYDRQSRAIGRAVEIEGPVDSLFELADGLTERLAAAHTPASGGEVSSAASQGTRSVPALRAFLEGERQFRSGHYAAAIVAYQQATATDSGFALAYLRVSQAANWTGEPRLSRSADEHVQALRDRLPPRQGRRAEAWHQLLAGNARQADSLYRVLVTEDATDVEAWYYLADGVFHQGTNIGIPAAESRSAWEHVIALSPEDASAYIHMARLDAASGDRAAFDTIARRVERIHPSEEVSFELRALRAFAFGDSASRAAVARAHELGAMTVSVGTELAGHVMGSSVDLGGVPAVWDAVRRPGVQAPDALGRIWLYQAAALAGRGDLARANVSIDSAMAYSAAEALRCRAFLATLPFSGPNPAELARVRAAIERGDTIAFQRGAAAWREFFRGLIALRSGDTATAARLAASVEQRAVREKNVAVQLGPILRADVLLREGRLADALQALGPLPNVVMWIGDPSSGLASAHDRWLRGELLARLGRDREALRVFASFPDVTGSDVVYAPAAHLRRGEILERAGDASGAAGQYRRALGYWATARPEVAALVARSRAGLTRVTAPR